MDAFGSDCLLCKGGVRPWEDGGFSGRYHLKRVLDLYPITGIPGEIYSEMNPFSSRLAGDNRSDAFCNEKQYREN